ncbi:MAG: hypothetical protein R3E70_15925 [Burkholderiaceae bacterium]
MRAASTLILLRDAADGVEVLMLKRHGLSETLGGAFVFPGGKVDAEDAALDGEHFLDQTASVLHDRLGEQDIDTATAVGLYVAALRETFEESGLLLAQQLAPAQSDAALARLAQGTAFNALLAELQLRLCVDALAPWSRWITPPSSANKRFDTRFFVARARRPARPPRRTRDHRSRWCCPAPRCKLLGRRTHARTATDHDPGPPRAPRHGGQRTDRSAPAGPR